MKNILNKNILSYILGTIITTFGIVLSVKANLGLSMIAATPYIFSKYFIKFLPWISQGKAEYLWNLVIIFVLAIVVKKWKWSYLLAFVTSFVVGTMIDIWLFILGSDPFNNLAIQIIFFVLGAFFTSVGIAFYFRTKLPQQAYELFVVEFSNTYNKNVHKVKQYYDYGTLLIDVVLSLLLFKGFVGVGIGTLIITLFNSKIIKFVSNLLDKVGY